MDIVESPRKKRILIHTDYANMATGFGGHCKRLMEYLYKTGKYELANYAGGIQENPDFNRFPWKTYAGLPSKPEDIQAFQQRVQSEQNPHRRAEIERDNNYGEFLIDRVIQDFKPDIYLGVQDIWGVDFNVSKKWWNKVSCIIHWTADSLPLQEKAVEKAEDIKYHYTWAQFAVDEFQRLANKLDPVKDVNKIEAFQRVKCIPGSIDSKRFYKKSEIERAALREKYKIDKDTFCIGMLSRNQLRKIFSCSIEAFKLFKRQNPTAKAKLLLFTSWREGWGVKKFIEEYELDNNDILAAYRCKATGEMFIIPFAGEELDNPITGDKKTLVTVGIDNAVNEDRIVDWYNLLDVFTLPITSGGLEYGALQAKLCELITIINDYSCFEDMCVDGAASLKIDWVETREIGTNFIKAVPSAYSLSKQFDKVYHIDKRRRAEMGRQAKDWAVKRFDIQYVGKQFEELFDSLPHCEWDFDFSERLAKLDTPVPATFPNAEELVKFAYREILNWPIEDVRIERTDLADWKKQLEGGLDPSKFLEIIRSAGAQHNSKQPNQKTPEQYLRESGVKEDAVLIVFKESGGDIALFTSLLPSLRNQYKDHQLVMSCDDKFKEILEGNENLDLVVIYQPFMDSQLLLQGTGTSKPLVFKSLHPRTGVQQIIDYLGKDNIALQLN